MNRIAMLNIMGSIFGCILFIVAVVWISKIICGNFPKSTSSGKDQDKDGSFWWFDGYWNGL